MKRTPHATTRRPPAASLRPLTVIVPLVLLAMLASSTASLADEHPVNLGDAESFAVLAGQEVTNTGLTTIAGDIGIHPGDGTLPNLTDNGTITQTSGTVHDANQVALDAQADLVIAYDDAASRAQTAMVGPQLDGGDLGPGVYDGGALNLASGGQLILRGGADDVWIFRASSSLIFESGSQVVMADDADPCNVFWRVESSATLGTTSSVVGTIMALTSISLQTGATLEGRALARNDSVTMDSNTITNAACTTPVADDDTTSGTDDTTNGSDDTTSAEDTTNGTDDTTSAEDDTTNGTDDTTSAEDTTNADNTTDGADDTTGDDDTTGQVQDVPDGAVAAGGGPAAAATSGLPLLLAAVLMLLMVAGPVGVIARRRGQV